MKLHFRWYSEAKYAMAERRHSNSNSNRGVRYVKRMAAREARRNAKVDLAERLLSL